MMTANSFLEDQLLYQIRALGLPEPEREYRGAVPGRRYRFDFAWPARRLLIEVQGATYTRGAHSTGSGIARDMDKLNLATLNGWRVLQFDRKMVENGIAVDLIAQALNISKLTKSG